MILVRDEFQCGPGGANEFVARFKGMAERLQSQDVIKRYRILTDLSGSFDTVVVESEIESLDDYFGMMRAMFANPEFEPAQTEAGNRLYQTGTRSFYTIEATIER